MKARSHVYVLLGLILFLASKAFAIGESEKANSSVLVSTFAINVDGSKGNINESSKDQWKQWVKNKETDQDAKAQKFFGKLVKLMQSIPGNDLTYLMSQEDMNIFLKELEYQLEYLDNTYGKKGFTQEIAEIRTDLIPVLRTNPYSLAESVRLTDSLSLLHGVVFMLEMRQSAKGEPMSISSRLEILKNKLALHRNNVIQIYALGFGVTPADATILRYGIR